MKYLFFVAWLRAREKKLADPVDFDRMIGAPNIEEGFKVLNDTDYGPFLSGKTYLQIEEIIEKEKEDLKKSLNKMGLSKGALNLLFLKDDLILLGQELKEKIFKGSEKEELIKKYPGIAQRIQKAKPESAEKIDDLIIEIYFKKSIQFLKKIKEEEALLFFSKYWKKISQTREEDLEKRDSLLIEMEDEIVQKSVYSMSGLMPILAYFIKKRRSESFVRTIFASKKIGLDSSKIYNLIERTRTL